VIPGYCHTVWFWKVKTKKEAAKEKEQRCKALEREAKKAEKGSIWKQSVKSTA